MAGIRVELTPEQFNELKGLYAWEVRDDDGRNVMRALVDVTKDSAFDLHMSYGEKQQFLKSLDAKFMSAARTKLVNDSRFSRELQAEFSRKKLAFDVYGLYSEELR